MSDSYQAIYDAVRSRIQGCDVGQAIREAAHLDASYAIEGVKQEFCITAYEMRRPFVLMRPKMYPDGGQWCALYGDNLQDGIAGFGDTPEKAALDFDVNWLNQKVMRGTE